MISQLYPNPLLKRQRTEPKIPARFGVTVRETTLEPEQENQVIDVGACGTCFQQVAEGFEE